jgi:altronate hydrolase
VTAVAALRLHPDDSVLVALRDIAAGESVGWQGGGVSGTVGVTEDVPLGHKIGLVRVRQGGDVTKYGARIGVATRDIGAGSHVHVHNLASARVRSRP